MLKNTIACGMLAVSQDANKGKEAYIRLADCLSFWRFLLPSLWSSLCWPEWPTNSFLFVGLPLSQQLPLRERHHSFPVRAAAFPSLPSLLSSHFKASASLVLRYVKWLSRVSFSMEFVLSLYPIRKQQASWSSLRSEKLQFLLNRKMRERVQRRQQNIIL